MVGECQFARFSCKALALTGVVGKGQKRKEDKWIEQMSIGLEPPSPLKPSEKAVTMRMSKGNAQRLQAFEARSKSVMKQT